MLTERQLNINPREQIRSFLLTKKGWVDKKLESIRQEDSTSVEDLPESSEIGDNALESSIRETRWVVQRDLLQLQQKIGKLLQRIERGTYEVCETCGRNIGWERLQVFPTTTVCVSCAAHTLPVQRAA